MPLILMLGSLFLAHIGLMQSELHLVVVMLLSLTVTMFVEFFRKHNLRETMDDVQAFFDGMGTQFANVVTLVVAGEIFAKGLTTIGTVDAVIRGAEHSGLGGIGVMIIMALVIAICAIVMGSGNAPFMSFASLIPNIAAGLHVPAVVMIMPMHFATTLARRWFRRLLRWWSLRQELQAFRLCGGEANSDPHGSRFRGEYDCHNHAILLSH